MSRRLTWSLILGVALSLSVMVAASDQDAITSLLRHDLGALTLKTALIVCAGGLLLVLFKERLSKVFEAALFWTVVGLLLVVGYTYRYELGDVGDRVIAQLMPGHVAGLPIEVLDYSVNVDTANGRTRAAPVTLARLAVGNLTEHDVPALVVQRGQLHNNLLGMSFLNRLESWEVRGDKLRMRGTP